MSAWSVFSKNVSFCGLKKTRQCVDKSETEKIALSTRHVIVLRQHTVTMEAYLSLQSADEDLLSLQLLLLLQQRLLQLLHPQLAVLTQLLLQAQLSSSLRGRLQGLPQLQTHTHTCTYTFTANINKHWCLPGELLWYLGCLSASFLEPVTKTSKVRDCRKSFSASCLNKRLTDMMRCTLCTPQLLALSK